MKGECAPFVTPCPRVAGENREFLPNRYQFAEVSIKTLVLFVF